MGEGLVLKAKYIEDLGNSKEDRDYFSENKLFLTRDQYQEYKKLEIEAIRSNDFIKLEKNPSKLKYGKISLRNNLSIGLRDYLNIINYGLGYEYLPNSYKELPIYINSINGAYEEWGNLACPEIVELAILGDGIELINQPISNLENSLIYKDIEFDLTSRPELEFFWDIRINALDILMDKSYSLEERLILLRVYFDHLDLLVKKQAVSLIPEKIDDLRSFFSSNAYKIFFKRLPKYEYFTLEFLEYLIKLMDGKIFPTSDYSQDMILSLNGLMERLEFLDLRTIYFENKKIFDNWYRENPSILENYLINEFLKEALPYGELDFKEGLDRLIVDFILVKNLLLANSIYTDRLDGELLISKITNYSRFKIENPEFIYIFLDYFRRKNLLSLEGLSLIL